jgi:Spy/CpxP family protein refolding chaperone
MRQSRSIAVFAGALVIAGAMTLAATPEAADQGRRGGFSQKLGLAPEQAKQMEQLRTEFAKARVKRRAEVEVARIELMELMRAPQLDDKAILAKAKLLGDLEAAGIRERVEHRLSMAKVLTPEQRAKARDLLGERPGRHARGHERVGRHGRRPFGHDGGEGPGPARWHGADEAAPDRD